MNRKMLPLVAILLSVSFLADAQTKDKVKKEKESDVIIRQKGDAKEKMTIVIDGKEITVNGKPLADLKDSDVEIFQGNGLSSLLPRIRNKMAPLGNLRMLDGDMAGNSAYLGVTSNASDKGAKIVSVQKESPAEKAGFKKDDIITKVDDAKIENSNDLYEAIGKYKPEEKVNVTYLRDDKESTTAVTLGKNTNAGIKAFDFKDGDFNGNFNFDMPELRNLPRMNGMYLGSRKPRLGLEIQDLEEGKGVKVLDVDDDTPASKAGLKKDDVISEINGKSITSVDDLQTAVRGMKEGDSFAITYKRGGQSQTTEIKSPKKLKTAEL